LVTHRKVHHCSGWTSFVKRFCFGLFLIALSLFSVGLFSPGPIQRASYMGAQYCGSCHQEEYIAWSSSPHARAHEVLPPGKKNDPQCLSCHATGHFQKNEPLLPGVQCEACHGPGQFYAALHIKKDQELSRLLFMQRPVGEKGCRHCHSVDSKIWSAPENMKKIDHWSKSRVKGENSAGIKKPSF